MERPSVKVPDGIFLLPNADVELRNAAVVEFKWHPQTPQQLFDAEEQLLRYLQQTGVRTGLLIVPSLGQEARTEFRGSSLSNVFKLDFEKFRSLITHGELESVKATLMRSSQCHDVTIAFANALKSLTITHLDAVWQRKAR